MLLPSETVRSSFYFQRQVLIRTNSGVRAEWAKSRARLARWTEEVELTQEEMRRVVHFLGWKASQWRSRASGRIAAPDLEQGLGAYATRQSDIAENLAKRFARKWTSVLADFGLKVTWPDFVQTAMADEGPPTRLSRKRRLDIDQYESMVSK